MDDLSSHDFTPSTVIDTDAGPSASGGGAPDLPREPEQPQSLRDDLEHVFKASDRKAADAEKAKAEPDAKAEVQPKEEPKPPKEAPEEPQEREGEQDKPEEPKEGDKAPEKPADGKRNIEAPKNFLPKAKEVWRNTPRDVQTEVERLTREHEQERERHREIVQRYDSIREYDELAQRNGTTLREAIGHYNKLENDFQANPLAAINDMLLRAGPTKPDGQRFSLYEVAQAITQAGPQGYQQMMAQAQQAPQQQQGPSPEVQQLQQQIETMRQQQLVSSIIDPFRAEHARYDELQDDIAKILQSGMIPESLSLPQRLAAAYDMAERINPPSNVGQSETRADPAPDRRADESFSGSKSIRSAPGSVSDDVDLKPKDNESIEDSLRAELRRQSRK